MSDFSIYVKMLFSKIVYLWEITLIEGKLV